MSGGPAGGAARRAARRLPTVAWLTLLWVMLWGTWQVGTALAGLLVALVLTTALRLPDVDLPVRLRPWGLVRFGLRFAGDVVVSSAQVAWWAVRPGRPPGTAIVGVRLRTRSDVVLATTAGTLTLVPGSVVLDADREARTIYAHVLGLEDEDDVRRFRASVLALEERVVRAVGSDAALAAVERGAGASGLPPGVGGAR